jgi:LPXTG-motif cell wall-anchored protein
VGGQDFELNYTNPANAAMNTTNFFTKYKTPLIIGGVAVALVGGFLLLKKKK